MLKSTLKNVSVEKSIDWTKPQLLRHVDTNIVVLTTDVENTINGDYFTGVVVHAEVSSPYRVAELVTNFHKDGAFQVLTEGEVVLLEN